MRIYWELQNAQQKESRNQSKSPTVMRQNKKNVKEDYEDTKYSQNNWENSNKLKEGESIDNTVTDMGDTWGGNGKQVETITVSVVKPAKTHKTCNYQYITARRKPA